MAKRTSHSSHEQSRTSTMPGGGSDGSSKGLGFEPSRKASSFEQDKSDVISNGEIAVRAYEIYEKEGRLEGHDLDNWLRAETELRSERHRGKSPDELPRSVRIRETQQSPAV